MTLRSVVAGILRVLELTVLPPLIVGALVTRLLRAATRRRGAREAAEG